MQKKTTLGRTMISAYLSFEKCVDRLKDSFLIEFCTYQGDTIIDFQHPSIRDMILNIVQKDPLARLDYLKNATTEGILTIIEGLSQFEDHKEERGHFLVLQSQNELAILRDRLIHIINIAASLGQVRKILMAINQVIWKIKGRNVLNENGDASAQGTAVRFVAKSVIEDIGSRHFYCRHNAADFSDWKDIVYYFYSLNDRTGLDVQLSYLDNLLLTSESASIEDRIEFLRGIEIHASDVFERIFTVDLEQDLNDLVVSGLKERCEDGRSIEGTIYPDSEEFDRYALEYWHDDAERFLEAASTYYQFYNRDEPPEIDDLANLLSTVSVSDNDEDDDFESVRSDNSSGFWTISRIFEDL